MQLKLFFIKILRRISENIETIRFLLSRDPILLNGWFIYKLNHLKHRNFGDELNIYLMQEILPCNQLYNYNDICKWGRKNKKNYLVIGSLIDTNTATGSIIWGAGVLEGGQRQLVGVPFEVRAVRGPLSREYLLNNNIKCPEIYGDPALLLPFIYNHEVKIKYDIGIIPHISDLTHPQVSRLEQIGIHIIRFDQYDHWHNVIDEIRSCKTIISSSLHGLILSDAYSIPNCWITLGDKLAGGHMKFYDYFLSVDRNDAKPFIINENTTKDDILDNLSKWHSIHFDPLPLINCSPWPLSIDINTIPKVFRHS